MISMGRTNKMRSFQVQNATQAQPGDVSYLVENCYEKSVTVGGTVTASFHYFATLKVFGMKKGGWTEQINFRDRG